MTGLASHKASITGSRAGSNDGPTYLPHRAYPTIQLHKTEGGGFSAPCLVSFYAYLDMNLQDRPQGYIDDWFSFATLSPDPGDGWTRTVLVNIVHEGYLFLEHVPVQGKHIRSFQADSSNDPSGALKFPHREWVRIDIYIDFAPDEGCARVWQNGFLVSAAEVSGGRGKLEQAHFGLYASAAIDAGVIYNDELTIREVANEQEALDLVLKR